MFRIKRIKALPPQPMDALTGSPAPAVHYALSVGPDGGVTGWTAERSEAAEFSDVVASLVERHYAKRPGAGLLSCEPTVIPEPEPELAPEPEPEPKTTPVVPAPTPRPTDKPARRRQHTSEEL